MSLTSHASHSPLASIRSVIFGSNTNVGKTLLTAGLCRHASLHLSLPTCYIKPVQAGVPHDESVVSSYSPNKNFRAKTLFKFDPYPCSPHLASALSGLSVPYTDVCDSVEAAFGMEPVAYVETAGGVLSPSTSFSNPRQEGPYMRHGEGLSFGTQADAYAALSLPSLLVGDCKLGGVSVTLSSLEALLSRRWEVDCIVFVGGDRKDEMMKNHETVESYLEVRTSFSLVALSLRTLAVARLP